MRRTVAVLFLVSLFLQGCLQARPISVRDNLTIGTEKLTGSDEVWTDPGFTDTSGSNPRNGGTTRAVVWFDEQLLGDGASFVARIAGFAGHDRHELRRSAVNTLKALSERSFKRAKPMLAKLEREGRISKVKAHWIVNSFTCNVTPEGLVELKKVPGVRKIFQAFPDPASGPSAALTEFGKRSVPQLSKQPVFDPENSEASWNVEKIGAVRTWKELKVTGEGTINAVHDFGFQLDVPNLVQNIYRDPREIPDNGKDDDGNGYIDDHHGFDFDNGNAELNLAASPLPGLIHGSMCAGIISGTVTAGSPIVLGIAPRSKWVPLMGVANIEEALEWAIDHNVDTFSMSYSLANLGEFRSHWRKAMEQATICGLFLVSGAGNFANEKNPNFAPVPVQMRVPEDIPLAVFGAAGVDKNLQRPPFSSQGPVEWNTDHYKDGKVQKPDIDGFNLEIPFMSFLTGKVNDRPIQGNSCAGPHIAGVLSLMISADPELTPWEARQIITSTATDVLSPGFDLQSGSGLANAFEAVKEVLKRKSQKAGRKSG